MSSAVKHLNLKRWRVCSDQMIQISKWCYHTIYLINDQVERVPYCITYSSCPLLHLDVSQMWWTTVIITKWWQHTSHHTDKVPKMFSQSFHRITLVCLEKCLKFVGKLYIVQQTRVSAHCYWSGSVFIILISFTGFKHNLSLKLCDFWRFFREMFTNFCDMFQNFSKQTLFTPTTCF